MSYVLQHTVLGFCWWDLPALLVLVGIVVWAVMKHRKYAKIKKELEDALVEKDAAQSVEGPSQA